MTRTVIIVTGIVLLLTSSHGIASAQVEGVEENQSGQVYTAPRLVETPRPVEPPPFPNRNQRIPGHRLHNVGWILLGAGYGLSLVMGATFAGERPYGTHLFIPVAGPVIFSVPVFSESESVGGRILGLLSLTPSMLQVVGLTLAVVGHVKESKWKDWQRENMISFSPIGPNGSAGLSISGWFF